MIEFQNLREAEQAVLEEVYEAMKQDEEKIQAEIAEETSKNKSQISKAIDTLEEEQLAERQKEGNTKKISITDKGAKLLLNMIAGTEEELNNLLSLHNFTVKYPITNLDQIKHNRTDNWREKILNKKELDYTYFKSNDTYKFTETQYHIRITRENLIVTIDELVGDDPTRLKTRALKKANKGRKKAENLTPIETSKDFSLVEGEIINQHLAIMRDPLSKIVKESEAVGTQVKITDRNGEKLFLTDNSKGRNDLEAGDFGKKGSCEDNIQKMCDLYSWYIQNEEIHRRARKWMEEKFS